MYQVVKHLVDENLTQDFEEEFLSKCLFSYLVCQTPNEQKLPKLIRIVVILMLRLKSLDRGVKR